jgi:hypothetical protein
MDQRMSLLPVCALSFFICMIPVAHLENSKKSVSKEAFCRVMHHASFNGFLIAKPIWGLVSELTLDENGFRRLQEEKALVLGTQGKFSIHITLPG